MAYTDHIVVDGITYDMQDKEAVSFAQTQTLTDAQKTVARGNIGAASMDDCVDEIASQLNTKADIITRSTSGAIATFSDGADDIPVEDLTIAIEPVQAGSGDPSPDNVRPITGWTGANIHVSPTHDAQDGQTYSITFPAEAGTVYGGTLDVTTGLLTVDRASVDLGTRPWSFNGARFTTTISNVLVENYRRDKGICSAYPVSLTTVVLSPDKSFIFGSDSKDVYIKDSAYTDADAFKAAMSGVQLVYELATPVTYQLDPTEVKTLLGDNNIWADTGDSTVTYRADTTLYVDAIKAEAEAKVSDVQVNGTSIVTGGVANIVKATDAQVKAGTETGKLLVPSIQNAATFYGLAKAAGADMASSANAVGTYTEEAKIAIQKMLGIYEAPWELIREDTFTNETEADHVISVDGNGEPFELTDVILMLIVPKHSADTNIGDYGRIYLYNAGSEIRRIYLLNQSSKLVQAESIIQTAIACLLQDNGLMTIGLFAWNNNTSRTNYQIVPNEEINRYASPFAITTNYIDSIKIGQITGLLQYRLFGKRKWN